MVIKRQCSFCAREIEPGTGMMFVKRDGTVYHFCTSSCRKQQLHLHRVGHRFKWTRAHELKRAADRSTAAQKAPAQPTPAPAAKALRGRPARRPEPKEEPAHAPPAAEPAPAAKPAPPAEEPKTTEPTPPAPAAQKKPRRPRKKAESAPSE